MSYSLPSIKNKLRIGVIGAGINGMGCAYRLQTELVNVSVTVVADDFTPNLTSDGAAGLWEIYHYFGTDPNKIVRWSLETYAHLKRIAVSSDSREAGVTFLRLLSLSVNELEELPSFKDKLENFRRMTLKEIQSCEPKCKDGYSYTTMTCEPSIYLPWLTKKFVAAGGRTLRARVTDMYKFCDAYDLVINCSGLGAAELANDLDMVPVRGQVVKVAGVSFLNSIVYASTDFVTLKNSKSRYIIPGRDMVTLGGTYEIGEGNTRIDEEEKNRIMKSCTEWHPRLKNAKFEFDWCGLRPYRKGGVRLEIDRNYHHSTNVIHNYGHAGIGVSLHWGCAGDVLDLARQSLGYRVVTKSRL